MSKPFQQQIGAQIRAARLAKGMSLSQAAEHMPGLDKSRLWHIERGHGNTTVETLVKIAAGLGCELIIEIVEVEES